MITKALEKGQKFTFSSTDNDFIGSLCEDKIGIKFSSKAARKLSLVGSENIPVSFEMLTNNHIRAKVNETDSINIVYADKHLIVGTTIPKTHIVVNVDGD